jgi:hypothetical protein
MTKEKGTQNKKTKAWSEAHVKKYNALYTRYVKDTKKKLNIDTYIDIEKRNLLTYIENTTLGDSRKKDYFYLVGRYLDIKNDRYADQYKQKGYDYYKMIESNEEEGHQTQKEIDHYMSMPTIRYVRENISNDYSKIDKHYQYLLLSLISLHPSMRPDFYLSAEFIKQQNQDDKKGNFVFVNNKTKKMHYIINNDKISKARSREDKIEIESPELKSIILDSLKHYSRTYLFEDTDGSPYTYYKILSLLRRALKNPSIGFSMIRSSYVNDFYENNTSVKSRKKLALQMRHTMDTALTHYNKPNITKDNESCDDVRAQLEIIKVAKIDDPIIDQKYKIARSNNLIKINQRKSTPRQITIDKYDLVYNVNTKTWN